MDINRILCPVDLSEMSAHAVDLAIVVAGYYNARLTALHVVSPTEPSVDEAALEDRRQETVSFVSRAAAPRIDVDVMVDVGQPARGILDRAASLPADLIVMGTHGRSGFEHLVLGSVAEKVLRQAACPVLTVPPGAVTTRATLPLARLLCAVDFSDGSESALRAALSLSEQSGAHLTLLHVLGLALAEFRRYTEDSARHRLESLVPKSAPLSRVATRLVSGKPYARILDVAAEEGSDLIILGVRGRQPLDLALFGSTANHVVRRATCAVLTTR
jgi:nucleotide-binding universal stress UspA family protein